MAPSRLRSVAEKCRLRGTNKSNAPRTRAILYFFFFSSEERSFIRFVVHPENLDSRVTQPCASRGRAEVDKDDKTRRGARDAG